MSNELMLACLVAGLGVACLVFAAWLLDQAKRHHEKARALLQEVEVQLEKID